MPDIDEEIETIRVILPTPPVVKINVSQAAVFAAVPTPLLIGPYMRFVSIVGPPNGGALEVFDVGSNTWVEQERWTE